MIDTGSTRSFISPEIANKYFSDYKYQEPFEVVSTHARSNHNEVIHIPLLKTFRSTDSHKFYLYEVNNNYGGLIGSDLLKQLDASVDMKNQILKTRDTEIPILYNPPYTVRVEPRSETRVKVPVNLYEGDAITNHIDFGNGVRTPAALVKCSHGFALTVIQNTSNDHFEIKFTEPISVTKFENDEVINVNNTQLENDHNKDEILNQNLNKLRLDHMNQEERDKIFNLCSEYKDIFYAENLPLTFTNQVKHKIRTVNEDPIYIKPYRQPPAEAAEIRNQVEKLLGDNVIKESHSPWSAPVHLVPKKLDATGQQKFRMVIDYRRLNDITVDDKYPLPNITDLFDKLGKSCYFSVLDLASGYHQIEIEEEDQPKTAFSTQFGHYEFLRMPFGLKTAPATFQRAMDNVLRGLQGIHCLIYLDDIIIFSSSLDEHLTKLRAVFDRLRDTNLKVQLDKSEFLCKEVTYLGHTITPEGLKPNTDKIDAILNYPLPKTTTEIKSFLGLIGYYRKFIKDFSKITQPMTACLKKNSKIVIDEKYLNAFEKCKELLISAPLLQYPDFEKPFILTTDASDFAIGAVLSQGSIGSDRPIAYASRTLNDSEKRYSTIEKELLAIVWAVKHFRPYLYGNQFTIYTDHRPLAWLDSLKEPNSKLTRYKLRLGEYNFKVIHKNGKQNTNADALSRIRLNALGNDKDDQLSTAVNVGDSEDEDPNDYIRRLTADLEDLGKELQNRQKLTDSHDNVDDDDVDDHTRPEINPTTEEKTPPRPPSNSSTISAQNEQPASSSTDTAHSALDMDTNGIPILHEAIDTKPNQILVDVWFKNELSVKIVPHPKQKILQVHLPLDNSDLIKQFLKEYIRPKVKYFIYYTNKEHRRLFTEVVIALFRKDTVQLFECTERIINVTDEKEQEEIVKRYHSGKTCHRGINETVSHIKRTYFWNNMEQTVAAIINSCETCKRMKYDRRPFKPKLQFTQTQNRPFQELFIDLYSIEGKYYLTIIDAFSKLAQALEIPDRSTPEVARALIKYFSFYGVPTKISSDPGSEFNSKLLQELLSFYKVQIHIGTPHNPNSMGLIERFHSTIGEIYRLAKYERKITDAASVMTYAILAYNQTIHSVTGLTPFEVVFGHTESNSQFDINFEKQYTQQLVKDHAKRTQYLYKYLSDKMLARKEKIQQSRSGETDFDIHDDDVVFVKGVNTRRAKDKPKYQKGKIQGQIQRNVATVETNARKTRVPIKDIRRPPQVRPAADPDGSGPSSATSKD